MLSENIYIPLAFPHPSIYNLGLNTVPALNVSFHLFFSPGKENIPSKYNLTILAAIFLIYLIDLCTNPGVINQGGSQGG